MLRMRSSVCIEASASKVWAHLCALEEIPRWSWPVLSATCPAARSAGVGAERVCVLRGNLKVRESWSEWSDEEKYFKYEASGIPMVKRATNRWSVQEDGSTRSLLVSEAEVELRGGLLAKLLLEPPMRRRMNAMGQQSLAALKYLVETGREFRGNHSALPAPQGAC